MHGKLNLLLPGPPIIFTELAWAPDTDCQSPSISTVAHTVHCVGVCCPSRSLRVAHVTCASHIWLASIPRDIFANFG